MKPKTKIPFLIALAVLVAAPVRADDVWGLGVVEGAESQVKPASYGVLGAMAGVYDDDTCSGDCGTCDTSCDTCCAAPCCCDPVWTVFAEILYLRPGNVDVVYATEQTSFIPALASPTGPIGRVNPDNGTGFRVGAGWALHDCGSIVATYSWLKSDTSNMITATPGNVMNLEVGHPSVVTSGASSIAASADYEVDLQLLDVDYRTLLWGNGGAAINYSAGLRYGHLSQDFVASQDIFAAAGLTTVASQIDFDGFGIRFGLDGEKRHAGSGILLYAKGNASFVGGEFKADFVQSNQFGGAAVIRNNFEDYRLVTILDAELGMGWESAGGRFRLTGGYLVSGWLNSLTTGTYIDGVQGGNYTDLAETLTFNGLVGHVEFRY